MGNPVSGGYATTEQLMPVEITIDYDKFMSRHDPMGELGDAVLNGIKSGIKAFKPMLRDKLKENLANFGLADSEIANDFTIKITADGNIELIIGTDYAIYVEIKTGIVGKYESHPQPQIGWEYDVKNHGTQGWHYYDESRDGKLSWTMGQPSRPFIYLTWLWARQSFTNTLDAGIRKEIKKWGRMVGK